MGFDSEKEIEKLFGSLKYYELFFDTYSPEWSVCVKGFQEPTKEQATEFFTELVEKYGKVTNVKEISEKEARSLFNFENEKTWPIFSQTKNEGMHIPEDVKKEHQERIEELNKIIVEAPGSYPGTEQTGVYIGGLDKMVWANDHLLWRCEKIEDQGFYFQSRYFLTLHEIYEQLSKAHEDEHVIITVFVNSPLRCRVYQCGNYNAGEWIELGDIQGYA